MPPNLIKFYTNAFAHMQKYFHRTQFGFLVIDDNYRMVCLAMSLYIDKKSENTWTKFLPFEKYLFPKIED